MTAKLPATSRPFPSGGIAATYSHLCLLYALSIIFALGSCTVQRVEPPAAPPHTVRLPWLIHEGGGVYIAWTPVYERVARAVLACVGLPTDQPRPTLWIAHKRFFHNENDSLMAVRPGVPLPPDSVRWSEYLAAYSPTDHAIVFSPIVPAVMFWNVFAHEITHSVERAPTPHGVHSPRFALIDRCAVTP